MKSIAISITLSAARSFVRHRTAIKPSLALALAWVLLSCAVYLLGACATGSQTVQDQGWVRNANQSFNKNLSQVYMGRFSISYLKDKQLQREQGSFEWAIAQRGGVGGNVAGGSRANDVNGVSGANGVNVVNTLPEAMQLSLLSPLGSTLAVIAYDPQANMHRRASMKTTTQTDYAPDLDSLMQRALGWRLPLAAMVPWLSQSEPRDLPNEWQIEVPTRHDNGMPRQINAAHRAMGINVRLVFER